MKLAGSGWRFWFRRLGKEHANGFSLSTKSKSRLLEQGGDDKHDPIKDAATKNRKSTFTSDLRRLNRYFFLKSTKRSAPFQPKSSPAGNRNSALIDATDMRMK